MHVVIYGTGGVGGYFGTRLFESGVHTTFIARGKHKEAIKKNGLQLNSKLGNTHIYPKVKENIEEIKDEIDLILICVKTFQLDEISEKLSTNINKETIIIPLLNGANNVEVLKKHIPPNQIIAGLCRIISKIESPGVINHFAYEPSITFGELDNKKTARLKTIKNIFDKADIKSNIPADIQVAIWTKYIYITSVSAIGALTRGSIGEMLEVDEIREIILKTIKEIYKIGITLGVNLKESIIEGTYNAILKNEYHATSSMQRDLMNGKRSELEAQNGYIVAKGRELNIDVPVNHYIYYSLLIQEKRNKKK